MTTIETNNEEFLWVQKYRPRKVADTILPKKTKQIFQEFVNKGMIPNMLLAGGPGTGKTTAARAMLDEINADYIIINGSMQRGIDVLRVDITNFASSVSFTGGRKYVIIDEADNLTGDAQNAFRGLVEEFSSNCGFILTCNFKNNIIKPIQESRFTNIDFVIQKNEKQKLEVEFFKRVMEILKKEDVAFSKEVLAKVIHNNFPDFRKTLNILQSYAVTGQIDAGILANVSKDNIDELFGFLKEKEFTKMRKWVAENSDQDAADLFRRFYEAANEKIAPESLPGFIVTLGEYSYKHSVVSDPEINMAAFLTEIMFEVTFK